MTPHIALLLLPVHYRTYQQYYADHKRYYDEKVEEQKDPKNEWRLKPAVWEEYFGWGPWLFNDVIGWLELGWDGADYMEAALHMRRKFLSDKVQRVGLWPEIDRPTPTEYTWRVIQNPDKYRHHARREYFEVWYGEEITKRWFKRGDNHSCVEALKALVQDAQERARQFKGHRFNCRRAVVWLPPFGLECINWVEATRQAKERAGGFD